MEAIGDHARLERELREAVASDGLKEQNQACDAAIELTNALPSDAGGCTTDGTFFQTENLLSYLSDEADLSDKAVEHLSHLSDEADASEEAVEENERMVGEGDDGEARRLVRSILAERRVELRATSTEKCCADLVGALAGKSLFNKPKPWVGSSTDRATHMDEDQQALWNSVRKRLPRLIAEKVRSKAKKDVKVVGQSSSSSPPDGYYEQLARSLEKRVATAMDLDAEDASCFVEVAKLDAELEATAAIAGHLLDQNARLRRAAAADKLHASHLEDVASGLTVVHDRLASRLEQCSTLVTACSALNGKAPQGTAVPAADPTTTEHESAIDELCTERLGVAAAITEALGKLEDEQKETEELADNLGAELIEACQGSVVLEPGAPREA